MSRKTTFPCDKDESSVLTKVIYQLSDSSYNTGILWTDAPRYSGLVGLIELNPIAGLEAEGRKSIRIEKHVFVLNKWMIARAKTTKEYPPEYLVSYIADFVYRDNTFVLAFESSDVLEIGSWVQIHSAIAILFGPYAKEEVEDSIERIMKRIQS